MFDLCHCTRLCGLLERGDTWDLTELNIKSTKTQRVSALPACLLRAEMRMWSTRGGSGSADFSQTAPPTAAPATKAVFLTTSYHATEHHFLLPTPSPSESWVKQDGVVAPIMFSPGALCLCCCPQGGLCYIWYLGSTVFRRPYCVWDVLVCCN